MTAITKVTARWDDRPGIDSGWYCETYSDGGFMEDDSQKIWFPVPVDSFERDELDELTEALREAFPNAEIVVSDD